MTATATTRTCSFCMTRMPFHLLAQVADSFQCVDIDTCYQRAEDAHLFAMSESELAVAAREAHQGAVTRQ